MTEIIYGSELSSELKQSMRAKVDAWVKEGKRKPCLAVILVGDNPASVSYVRGKEKACQAVGIDTQTLRLDANISQADLESEIRKCSNDSKVDGILIQLPLPIGLDEDRAIACVDPNKDVDGLHPLNFGKFFMNQPSFIPCTPLGIMELLKRMHCDPQGKHAVVIGRSKLVGTPVARLLQNANATVTICHSHTANLKQIANMADILIVAVGKAKIIDASYIKEGAYVIDVGVNSVDGHLCGDVDFDSALGKAGAITPVPKGVGPMTICMLLQNTITAYERGELHDN
ncbi:MAG: bifunctional methylenetetrahydrofolate dehydrogenase/methenyltetrahydrofolate cyclohydrolase FolD [Erysipelotrichaceae bacterium]|nr:bifunctional methylenetetrahydrofolate dehydrogenase/methenyltetrahydrofolate cyclohydrolase FolD [Erysipelotrichaceae bacterium]MDY6035377.1 bifunctional methylenetetrahydrofolate dehydrogenase/methenyltetrahydrofolate cyclohydrolase FolD [Bulleidia sp.]